MRRWKVRSGVRWAGCLAVAASLLLASSGRAITVTIDSADVTSIASRAAPSTENPAAVPASGAPSTASDTNSSTTTYVLADSAFSFGFDHARSAVFRETGRSEIEVVFSLDQEVEYLLDGSYSAIDPDGRQVELNVTLEELGGSVLFSNRQNSSSTPNESFALGGTAGDDFNFLSGSLTGTLDASTLYRLLVLGYVRNGPFPPGAPATGSGSVTLQFVPEPSTAPLTGLGLLVLSGSAARRRAPSTCRR